VTVLLRRASARYLLRHRWQTALAALGIALGVAVSVGVAIATGSARSAFALSAEAVAGRATHGITAGPAGLPEAFYTRLRVTLGVAAAAPIVEGYARTAGRTFRLLGVDPFAEEPFRAYVGAAADGFDLGAVLTVPGAVLLSRAAADALGVTGGDTMTALSAGVHRSLRIAGVLEPADALSARALADVLIADIATAQELTSRLGVLDRIDLRLPDALAGDTLRARIAAALPAGARIEAAGARAASLGRLSAAFEVNLAALGLLALVFGMFLIYNSMTFSVVQRREWFGLLRAQGVTRAEVLWLVLWEALALGVVATAAGLLLGTLLGHALVGLVARTINDLYFTVTVTGATVDGAVLARGAALGIGATLVAAFAPAREAVRSTPRAAQTRSALEERYRARTVPAAVAGVALLAGAAALLLAPTRSLAVSFTAVFTILIAGALLAPLATAALMAAAQPLAGRAFGGLGRMATRGVARTLSRTGPAIAALAVAVAVGIAIGVMVGSFRATVERWLDVTLQADVYVSTPGLSSSGDDARLAPALVERLRMQPGVAGVSTYRNVGIPQADGELRLVAADLFAAHRAAFTFLAGEPDAAWAGFERGALLVSEAYAYRRGLAAGDTVMLPTAHGDRAFRVAGVFADYASEHGVAFIDRDAYTSLFDDDAISSAGVFAADGVDADALLERLRTLDAADAVLILRSNRGLRAASLAIFDRTFAVTAVLRLLALAVAFVGVLSALMALQLERTRELGVLRASGLTPRQLWALVASQTGLMGLAAAAMAVPLGLGLAWLLVHVVNRRSFGWTIALSPQPGILLESAGLAVLAALLAGAYPAWRMARTPPAAALREE
jgi:putative ABC transport system permease protein